ncbi:MAG: hypothetical protein ACFB21_11710 [Opitutales bacterium]
MKFLDKILLLLAIAVLAASVVIFMAGPPSAEEVAEGTVSDSEFEPVAPEAARAADAAWPEPKPAEPDIPASTYYVFTPPQIFWHTEEETFVFKPFVPEPPPEPFGLVLRDAAPELYRVQFQTAIEQPGEDTLQFFLPGRGITIEGQAGDEFPEHGFEIREYDLVRRIMPDGTLFRVPTAIIYDEVVGEEIELNTIEDRVIEGEWNFTMETRDPNPVATYVWEGNPGEEIRVEQTRRRYVLVEAMPEAETVTVRKEFLDDPEKEPKEETLEEIETVEPAGATGRNTPGQTPSGASRNVAEESDAADDEDEAQEFSPIF